MQELSTFITHHPFLCGAVLILFVLLTIVELIRAKRRAAHLTPSDVTHKINRENAVIIDLRPQDLFKLGHIIDARPFTTDALQKNPRILDKFKTKPLILICNNGQESQKTAAFLIKSGYNAYSLAGGMRAWSDAHLPMIKD